MRAASKHRHCLAACLSVLLSFIAPAQTQTTGRITGTVQDTQGAVIARAEVAVENNATGEKRAATTDESGNYVLMSLSPGSYDVSVYAGGFTTVLFRSVKVTFADTLNLNAVLSIAQAKAEVTVNDALPLVRTDGAELSVAIDSRNVTSQPLSSRNSLQLLTLAAGVTAPLTNNSAIGRNSPNVSVNGARVTQNSYQINGVDANNISVHDFGKLAVPAPESITEVRVQTSLYDASIAGAGGASVQLITSSGTNSFHGSVYEYFQNEALNANDPNLKAVGVGRPVLKRNVYGFALGGPIRRNRAFYFVSYQGRRESNGATDQSLYRNVPIDPCLTNDRDAATLMAQCNVSAVDPTALALVNFTLPNARFLIPTPQTVDGLVSGTAVSTFHEEQFNANFDYRLSANDSLVAKFFFANAPQFNALGGSEFGGSSSLPGFGTQATVHNRILSLQEIHTFNPTTVNEARFGYNFIRSNEVPQEPLKDSDIGISRISADQFPGLPLIILARDSGGGAIGTNNLLLRGISPSMSLIDSVSLQRGKHNIRFGGEIRRSEWKVTAGVNSYGEIDFATFQDFLTGNSEFSALGTGFSRVHLRTTDYHLFTQDDWRISPRLTLNLGLRYELNPPAYEEHGLIGGFDPGLYRPRMEVDASGYPVGPPAGGMLEAANAQFGLVGVTRVGKRVLKSIDPKDFGPRLGIAWSPLDSGRIAVRMGYGIFFSRPSFLYLGLNYFAPPFFQISGFSGQPFANPFPGAPPSNSFPIIQTGIPLAATVLDRDNRNPYFQQFNGSIQFELLRDTALQVAYAGSRGVRLLRSVPVNLAHIASLSHPIVNAVTGEVITLNTYDNAALRAPMQGVDPGFFFQNQSTAQSTYHSVQATLNRRLSRGLQFSAAYTFSRSIDNTSNPGGGANSDGTVDRGGGIDTGNVWANAVNPRANRGLSDFDRTHVLTFNYVWDLPAPAFARTSRCGRLLLSNWQVSGIVTAMSGLPVDIFDQTGGSVYGMAGARPSWAPGANRRTALSNIPSGYYFNPFAFAQAIVQAGQPIPSAHDSTALAGDTETDLGNVGRNVLRGPPQSNLDFSIAKQFHLTESKTIQFRADFFNALNHPSRDNPVSNISVAEFGAAGNILSPGDFGRVLGYDSSPRVIQFALKVNF